MKPIIDCFIQSRYGSGDVVVIAVAPDGAVIAQHLSSNEDWAKSDIGINSGRKHDIYRREFPNGYELRWHDAPPQNEKALP